MESLRWLRLAPLAAVIAAGALGPGRPVSGAGAARRGTLPRARWRTRADRPGAGAWYRLDPVLDRTGTLAAQRLTAGIAGQPSRQLDLAPESFASGPVGGLVLAGEDDGTVSRLRLLDPARGCATAVADEPAVIRSAVLDPDGRSIVEHRVDRTTRADLGDLAAARSAGRRSACSTGWDRTRSWARRSPRTWWSRRTGGSSCRRAPWRPAVSGCSIPRRARSTSFAAPARRSA